MAPPSRDEAIAILEAGQTELDALFGRLGDEDFSMAGSIRGTDWAAKDLLGHIAFWEELALRTLDAARAGRPAEFAGKTTEQLNAENQEQYANTSATEQRARAASAHAALLAALQTVSDAEWSSPMAEPNPENETLGDRLGGVLGAPDRPFGHAYAHLEDLQAFVNSR
jgi:hypothetical protein